MLRRPRVGGCASPVTAFCARRSLSSRATLATGGAFSSALHGSAGRSQLRPSFHRAAPIGLLGGCGTSALACQRRHGVGDWLAKANPARAFKQKTKSEEELREELPTVFEQPQEVDDYIRPDKTFFERLEDWWDWIITFLSPVDKQLDWMRTLHHEYDLSWAVIFVLWGAMMRLFSLTPMLYANRNSLRMTRCQAQVSEITNKINALKQDKSISTPERRVLTDGYKRMEKAIYKKHKCSKYGSFCVGLTSPFMVTAFMAIRRLAAYEDDLESAKFLWITDLTMPDPTFILPLCCATLFLLNFEMNQNLNRGGRSAMGLYARWGVRVGCLIFAYWFQVQPACLFTYWIGMSLAGMLQPLLLRYQPFRDYWGFPDPPKSAQMAAEVGTNPLSALLAKIMPPAKDEEAAAKVAQRVQQRGHHFDSLDDYELYDGDEAVKGRDAAAAKTEAKK